MLILHDLTDAEMSPLLDGLSNEPSRATCADCGVAYNAWSHWIEHTTGVG